MAKKKEDKVYGTLYYHKEVEEKKGKKGKDKDDKEIEVIEMVVMDSNYNDIVEEFIENYNQNGKMPEVYDESGNVVTVNLSAKELVIETSQRWPRYLELSDDEKESGLPDTSATDDGHWHSGFDELTQKKRNVKTLQEDLQDMRDEAEMERYKNKEVKYPYGDPAELFAIFIGMDPALKADFFGVCVHFVPLTIDPILKKYKPILVHMDQIKRPSYAEVFEALDRGILNKFQNFTKLNIDSTRDERLGEELVDRFGESRIIRTKFTAGESGSKMQLMKAGLSALRSDYYFLPEAKDIDNAYMKDCINTLKGEMLSEQLILNPNNSVKFRHRGLHNDLLHAWALSIDPMMDWINRRSLDDGSHVGGQFGKPDPPNDYDLPFPAGDNAYDGYVNF